MNKKPSPLHRASEWIVDHYRLFFIVFAALLVFSAVVLAQLLPKGTKPVLPDEESPA